MLAKIVMEQASAIMASSDIVVRYARAVEFAYMGERSVNVRIAGVQIFAFMED